MPPWHGASYSAPDPDDSKSVHVLVDGTKTSRSRHLACVSRCTTGTAAASRPLPCRRAHALKRLNDINTRAALEVRLLAGSIRTRKRENMSSSIVAWSCARVYAARIRDYAVATRIKYGAL